MQVDICTLPEIDDRIGHEDAVVVVDALRASATVVALLEAGAERVRPVTARCEIPEENTLLTVGEHNGERLDGFDLDNSPSGISQQADIVAGRDSVILTTNGTQCVAAVNHVDSILMGSLVNKTRLVEFCTENLTTSRLWLLPARRHGSFAAEDMYSVVELWEAFRKKGLPTETTLEERAESLRDQEATTVFRESDTGEYLAKMGKADDISFCAGRDTCTSVPVLHGKAFIDAVENKRQ